MNFPDGLLDIAVGQTGKADLALGVVAAELFQPVVVDAQHLVRRLTIIEARGRSEDAVDDLGVDAVAIHILDPQMRVARAADVLLAVLEEAKLRHFVDPVVLAGDIGRATRPDAVFQPKIGAVLGDPLRPLRPVFDIGHAVLELAARLRHEQVGRHPRHVEMAIGRNSAVLHAFFSALRRIAIEPTVLSESGRIS